MDLVIDSHNNIQELCCVCLPACLQLIIGNSQLALNFEQLLVNGTFQMGTAACPITEPITVTVPGGNEVFGVDVGREGSYDVHGLVKVRVLR